MLNTIFLVAAVVGGTVMICQFVLTLLGMGHDGADLGDAGDLADVHGDAHFDGDSPEGEVSGDHHTSFATAADGEYVHHDSSWLFGVISLRTLVAAAAFFGVAGMAARSAEFSSGSSLVIAVSAGLAAMYGMYWLMRAIAGLTSSGNERITNALGRRATVYIPIPPNGSGAGKVQLSMQNRIVEFQAVSEELDRLRTGETVEVTAVSGNDLVRVRRIPQEAPAVV
jgi:membrane protein implicated in regulation of membrane protease activity